MPGFLDRYKSNRFTSNVVPLPKRKPKPFKSEWVKLPMRWVGALQQSSSVRTYQLAIMILDETFKNKRTGREVVLTAKMTGMPHSTRLRAANELVRLSLIEIEREGRQAIRVTGVSH
jgi:hypothetical protein